MANWSWRLRLSSILLACVFRLRFILCQRGIKPGGRMCQPTASLRPLSQKSYGGEEASRGRIHSCCVDGRLRGRTSPSSPTFRCNLKVRKWSRARFPMLIGNLLGEDWLANRNHRRKCFKIEKKQNHTHVETFRLSENNTNNAHKNITVIFQLIHRTILSLFYRNID